MARLKKDFLNLMLKKFRVSIFFAFLVTLNFWIEYQLWLDVSHFYRGDVKENMFLRTSHELCVIGKS